MVNATRPFIAAGYGDGSCDYSSLAAVLLIYKGFLAFGKEPPKIVNIPFGTDASAAFGDGWGLSDSLKDAMRDSQVNYWLFGATRTPPQNTLNAQSSLNVARRELLDIIFHLREIFAVDGLPRDLTVKPFTTTLVSVGMEDVLPGFFLENALKELLLANLPPANSSMRATFERLLGATGQKGAYVDWSVFNEQLLETRVRQTFSQFQGASVLTCLKSNIMLTHSKARSLITRLAAEYDVRLTDRLLDDSVYYLARQQGIHDVVITSSVGSLFLEGVLKALSSSGVELTTSQGKFERSTEVTKKLGFPRTLSYRMDQGDFYLGSPCLVDRQASAWAEQLLVNFDLPADFASFLQALLTMVSGVDEGKEIYLNPCFVDVARTQLFAETVLSEAGPDQVWYIHEPSVPCYDQAGRIIRDIAEARGKTATSMSASECTYQLVANLDQFAGGHIMALCLQGDIASDLLVWQFPSPGFLPSLEVGTKNIVAATTHGTADNLVANATINPLATILSTCRMLQRMGEVEIGERLMNVALSSISQAPEAARTPDMSGGKGNCFTLVDWIGNQLT